MRVLSVLKQRGSGYSGGQHAYRITAGGLRVFPRLADPLDLSGVHPGGAAGLHRDPRPRRDPRTTATGPVPRRLIAGPSGAGKTLMGLHFLYAGAAAG